MNPSSSECPTCGRKVAELNRLTQKMEESLDRMARVRRWTNAVLLIAVAANLLCVVYALLGRD